MWKYSQNLLRQVSRYKGRYFSITRPANTLLNKEVTQKFKLPENVLPSIDFLSGLDDVQQGKVARIIAELEAIYSVMDEVPTYLSESQWMFMITSTYQIYDRQDYLRELHSEEINQEKIRQSKEAQQKVYDEQLKRFEAGEIVYGNGFYELYSLIGKDFHRLINCYYGNRMWRREQLDNGFPRVYVDCRYLHKLNQTALLKALNDFDDVHNDNWTSREPLPVTFTNYLADDRISEAAKSKLKFFYGSKASSEDVLTEDEPKNSFVQAPFYPNITNRDFCSILPPDVQLDEVAYVTRLGETMLTEEILKKSKILIVHAFPEMIADQDCRLDLRRSMKNKDIKTYYLPLDRYVKSVNFGKSLQANTTISILRDILMNKLSWKEAFLKNLPSEHFFDLELSKPPESAKVDLEKIKFYVESTWAIESKRKTMIEMASRKKSKESFEPPKRVHRYTREERNRRRQGEISSQTH